MGDQRQKREFPRASRILLSTVEKFGDSGELQEESIGRTLNISEGGIMLEMFSPLPLLATVNVHIALGEEIIYLSGEVVHLRKAESGRIETGIEFKFITEGDKARIRAAL